MSFLVDNHLAVLDYLRLFRTHLFVFVDGTLASSIIFLKVDAVFLAEDVTCRHRFVVIWSLLIVLDIVPFTSPRVMRLLNRRNQILLRQLCLGLFFLGCLCAKQSLNVDLSTLVVLLMRRYRVAFTHFIASLLLLVVVPTPASG